MKTNQLIKMSALAIVLGSLIFGAIFIVNAAGDKAPQETVDLNGTSWKLSQLPGQDLVPGRDVTLDFADGQAEGSAGCNGYFGSVTVEDNSLSFGPIASTEMFCELPDGLMDQELAYLMALSAAASFQVEDDTLTLLDSDGEPVLVFVAVDN